MDENGWYSDTEFPFAFPRVRLFLGISVVTMLIIGTLSQCLVISSFIIDSPEIVYMFFLDSLIATGMVLFCNQLVLGISFFRLNEWITIALTTQIRLGPKSESDRLRFILTQSYRKSRIGIFLLLISLALAVLTIFIPITYLGGLPSIFQIVILLLACTTMSINILFELFLSKLERRYSEMHESELLEEIHSMLSKKPNAKRYEVEIEKPLNEAPSMTFIHLSFGLVFLWIGVTDLLFLL
ncbi:MAG: hypothetical protein P1Q69_06625 [Candidatus Thorarchaeota archaeon]|nr:hypothetical protein [Candidatus Thorarchaeota archaeon]